MRSSMLFGFLVLWAGCMRTPCESRFWHDAAEEATVKLPATYTCYRTADDIVIDGRLTEESWKMAPSTGRFRDVRGDVPGPLPTRAKMLWDDKMLYVAFECLDRDIYSTVRRRDDPLYTQDVVEVFISEQSRKKGHFVEYEVSPLGVIYDKYLDRPYHGDVEFNSTGLAAGTRVRGTVSDPSDEDGGYTVEIAIPLRDIWQDEPGPPVGDGTTIRLNLYRIDYATPKKIGGPGARPIYMAFSPTGKVNFHMPKRFGTLVFSTIPAGKQ